MRPINRNFAQVSRKVITAVLFIALISCKEKAPLTHQKMVALYTDIMILEGGHQAQYNYGAIPHNIWQRDYQHVCKMHQTDTALFRRSMEYYEKHPQEFSKLLEEVITGLQKQEMKNKTPGQ